MKTTTVTIQNHTRLLDAEMVDKLIHTEIKVTAEKGMYEEICALFRLVAPLDEYRPVANTGNYIVRAGYWSQDDISDLPAYPISSFFVDEVPADVVPETPGKDAVFVQMYEALKKMNASLATYGRHPIIETQSAKALAAASKFIKPVN